MLTHMYTTYPYYTVCILCILTVEYMHTIYIYIFHNSTYILDRAICHVWWCVIWACIFAFLLCCWSFWTIRLSLCGCFVRRHYIRQIIAIISDRLPGPHLGFMRSASPRRWSQCFGCTGADVPRQRLQWTVLWPAVSCACAHTCSLSVPFGWFRTFRWIHSASICQASCPRDTWPHKKHTHKCKCS